MKASGKSWITWKKNGLEKNTIVLYCGDQGFYMGEHGLYDKRWIFEESFRMPLIMKWPGHIKPGVRSNAMVQELDYAPTFCEVAGAATPENMSTFQGRSLTPLFKTGEHPTSRTVRCITPSMKILGTQRSAPRRPPYGTLYSSYL